MIQRRDFLKTAGLGTAALVTSLLNSRCSKSIPHPNIVYIIADDLGYGDLSCLNANSKLNTIHTDQLAQEGMIFTDAHSGSAVCTPTRYGILTGRYSWRSRLKEGVLWGYSRCIIPPDRTTVASLLKTGGYHTACIGKWHLGLDWQLTDRRIPQDNAQEKGKNVDFSEPIQLGPNQLGFDYSYIIPASLDMEPYVYVENGQVTSLPNRQTVSEDDYGWWREGPTGADFKHEEVLPKLTEKAVQYIDRHAASDSPFFLYFPLPAPHTPILPTEPFLGKSKTNPYGDFVLQVDDVVGQLLHALKEKGIEENTLVIFTSDNGCAPSANFEVLESYGHDPSFVFRGHKADIYEGGHRIPFIVRWPGQIKPSSTRDETICLTDLLATCAALLGAELPDNAGEDSINLLPAFLQQPVQKPLREATVHHSINGSFSIRKGKWKLEFCPGSGGWSYPRPGRDDMSQLPEMQLYDLETDIGETHNVIEEHTDVASDLQELLNRYILNGRSTFGEPQKNDGSGWWPQLWWMT